MKTAKFWHKLEDGRIECDLCPHHCKLSEGSSGLCRVRTFRAGELRAAGYGIISSAAVDPIEKKPLYHFFPGSKIFSFGGWGCNFACEFCQNWTISQNYEAASGRNTAEQVVAEAKATGSIGIAYTYNEPIIGPEFVEDCAVLARSKGLSNILVSNGYIERKPAEELLPLIDALNIDIKSMDDAFYRKYCRGRLSPVLAFAVQAVNAGSHVEITNLLIPGLNDSDELIAELALWIRDNLGKTTPLHLSAYHPQYKMNITGASSELLERAYGICKDELTYVYTGNISTTVGRATSCPECGTILISREGYSTKIHRIAQGNCMNCGRKADIRCH